MHNPIFGTAAKAYWTAGFSVVPVEPGTKKPCLTSWQSYYNNPPNERNRKTWLRDYSSHGIGLLLGTESLPMDIWLCATLGYLYGARNPKPDYGSCAAWRMSDRSGAERCSRFNED